MGRLGLSLANVMLSITAAASEVCDKGGEWHTAGKTVVEAAANFLWPTGIFFGLLLAALLFRRKLTPIFWIGLSLLLFGGAVIGYDTLFPDNLADPFIASMYAEACRSAVQSVTNGVGYALLGLAYLGVGKMIQFKQGRSHAPQS